MSTRALWIAAWLAGCGGEPPLPESWPLESVAEPWGESEAHELGPRDACRRLDDGRLFVELASDPEGIQTVTRLWIGFEPPLLPRVEVASWNEETSSGARWTRRDFRGQSWVDSDGMGLGQPGGPDLIVDTRWTCWISGSDQPGGLRLRVRAAELELALAGARPPGVIALAMSERSLLDVDAQPLEPGDTCRRLDDGRLFVELLRRNEVLRFWIAFDPPHLPEVHAACWQVDRERRPTGYGYLRAGRAWVSTRGARVGTPAEPDVILEAELLGAFAVSPMHRHVALLLDARALR